MRIKLFALLFLLPMSIFCQDMAIEDGVQNSLLAGGRPLRRNIVNNLDSERYVTVNAAYASTSSLSFGLSYGQARHYGWFVSFMTDEGFRSLLIRTKSEEDNHVNEELPFYTGKCGMARFSLMGGGIVKFTNAVGIRGGIGIGRNAYCMQAADKRWVQNKVYSTTGLDISLGMHFSLGDFVLDIDAVSTNFKTIEGKIGIGWSVVRMLKPVQFKNIGRR